MFASGNGSASQLEIFEFNASASNPNVLISKDTGIFPGGDANAIDWSPSGRYVVAVGENSSNVDTAIYEVVNTPLKCALKNNEVTNSCSGLCGIGLAGSSSNNLIIRNIGYGNCINFSKGVFNTFIGRQTGDPSEIENISINLEEDRS